MSSLKFEKSSLQWVAAQIKPNMLKKTCWNLDNQKLEYFAPRRWETVKSNESFRRVEKLLFPGYIFVRCDVNSSDILTINSTKGVSKVVPGAGNGPGVIPDGFIRELMLACSSSPKATAELREGEKVRFFDGPFAGMIGEVMRVDVNGRLKILFEVLGGIRKLTVDNKQLNNFIQNE